MVRRLVIASPIAWERWLGAYRVPQGPWPIITIRADSFPTADQIETIVEKGGQGAVLILQRVLPVAPELRALHKRYDRVLFDFDDAIYAVPPDLSRSWWQKLPRQAARLILRGSPHASSRRKPLKRTLRSVDACVVGNSILGDFARGFAPRVVEIPTTVDPVASPPASRPERPVIVWMGLPDNLQHLELVRNPLKSLDREIDFELRIVCSQTWKNAPVAVDFVAWSPEAAREALLSSSIGLAPLTDDVWTRGKCALRAIEYGGHALPTIASPVGITDRVIQNGKTGFLARSPEEWTRALRSLLTRPDLIDSMGAAALDHITKSYSRHSSVERWRELLSTL